MPRNPRNPAMSPHTQGHPGTRHTVITVEREKKKEEKKQNKGGMEGRQKTKKALPLKKRQPLRENKGCTTLFLMWFQIAATLSCVTYVNLSMYA